MRYASDDEVAISFSVGNASVDVLLPWASAHTMAWEIERADRETHE